MARNRTLRRSEQLLRCRFLEDLEILVLESVFSNLGGSRVGVMDAKSV
jgi:hypothetical protein